MLGKENLKALFHDVMEKRPSLKDINSFDTLLVQTHHTFSKPCLSGFFVEGLKNT